MSSQFQKGKLQISIDRKVSGGFPDVPWYLEMRAQRRDCHLFSPFLHYCRYSPDSSELQAVRQADRYTMLPRSWWGETNATLK